MDDDYSFLLTVCYFREFTALTVIDDFAFVGSVRVDTAQNLHEG